MTSNAAPELNLDSRPSEQEARPRVLTFAYACEPDKGSEPGGVWGLVKSAMDFADCVVLVGPEHVDGLRRWQEFNDNKGTIFLEVSEPRWAKYAKWHRIPFFLLYLSWLKRARRRALELLSEQHFDLAWHASFAVYWLPTPAVDLGLPSVWGPVGGAVTTPHRLWKFLGARGVMGEILDSVSVWLMATRPATRRTWRRATTRLLNSEETLRRLSATTRDNARVLNQALFADVTPGEPRVREPFVLFPSALEPRKGPRLAIAALAKCDRSVRLKFVHEGPEEKALRRIADRLGVADRVDFMGRLPRSEMFEMLAKAGVALFTGLKEDGGMALCEAALHGTPIVVLAHGGARVIAEATSSPDKVAAITPKSAAATVEGIAAAITDQLARNSQSHLPSLDQDPTKRALQETLVTTMRKSTYPAR